jgi:hypothetical protein
VERDQPGEGERGDVGAGVTGDAVPSAGPLIARRPSGSNMSTLNTIGPSTSSSSPTPAAPPLSTRRPP